MYQLKELTTLFLDYLEKESSPEAPHNLYEPVDYIMRLGGKRIRPALLLAAMDLYGADLSRGLPASYAIEMFHNFSLVHDDIMDKANLRRGKETVHIKWNDDTAILSGDVMLIKAYQYFDSYPAELFKKCVTLFSQTSKEICEGQRLDMDFETRDDVSIDDYIHMITNKTSVLLATALKLGAWIAEASDQDATHLYDFGKNVGIAFQIQDDILDTFGSDPKVGKQIGGDILNNKKTYLYLKSLELHIPEKQNRLKTLFQSKNEIDGQAKIDEVTALFKEVHVNVYAEELKEAYLTLGLSHLDAVEVPAEKKEILKNFASFLLQRKY